LTGGGLSQIGADARLTTGSYAVSKRWCLAFWEHPQRVDGLYYRSRHDLSRFCIVLFKDRLPEDILTAQPYNQSFLDESFVPEFKSIASEYGYEDPDFTKDLIW
jgi:hypothetical protein